MTDDPDVVDNELQRTQIDEFLAQKLDRAGYGGMDIAKTPMGTQIVLKAEKPGMVIGKGGKNIRNVTMALEEKFNLEDPQINVQEVDEPDLNARIVANRLADAIERGWYFRKAGHTTIDRIMESGALGAEIVLSGEITGGRSRVEKFKRGYIKHNGQPDEEVVDHGQATAVMKLGTIGVNVKIIPPDAELPGTSQVEDGTNISGHKEEVGIDTGELGVGAEASESAENLDRNSVLRKHADYFARLYALNEFSQDSSIRMDSDIRSLQPEHHNIEQDYKTIRTIVKRGEVPEDLAEHFAKELAQIKIKETSEKTTIQDINEDGVIESMKRMIMREV